MGVNIYFYIDNNSHNYCTVNNWYVTYEGKQEEWIATDIGTPINFRKCSCFLFLKLIALQRKP
jgi:hypothetical protein